MTPIKYDGEVQDGGRQAVRELNAPASTSLLDDRDARPGSKFADADLIGFPVRVTVGDRGLKDGKAEVKLRSSAEPEMVDLGSVIERVRSLLAG